VGVEAANRGRDGNGVLVNGGRVSGTAAGKEQIMQMKIKKTIEEIEVAQRDRGTLAASGEQIAREREALLKDAGAEPSEKVLRLIEGLQTRASIIPYRVKALDDKITGLLAVLRREYEAATSEASRTAREICDDTRGNLIAALLPSFKGRAEAEGAARKISDGSVGFARANAITAAVQFGTSVDGFDVNPIRAAKRLVEALERSKS